LEKGVVCKTNASIDRIDPKGPYTKDNVKSTSNNWHEGRVKQMQDVKERTPATCMTEKVSTARARILTTSALYLKVAAPVKATCSSRQLQQTGRSVATATTP